MGKRSLFGAPMRRESPAASTTAPKRGDRALAGASSQPLGTEVVAVVARGSSQQLGAEALGALASAMSQQLGADDLAALAIGASQQLGATLERRGSRGRSGTAPLESAGALAAWAPSAGAAWS